MLWLCCVRSVFVCALNVGLTTLCLTHTHILVYLCAVCVCACACARALLYTEAQHGHHPWSCRHMRRVHFMVNGQPLLALMT
jgi:hypothetical protein